MIYPTQTILFGLSSGKPMSYGLIPTPRGDKLKFPIHNKPIIPLAQLKFQIDVFMKMPRAYQTS